MADLQGRLCSILHAPEDMQELQAFRAEIAGTTGTEESGRQLSFVRQYSL